MDIYEAARLGNIEQVKAHIFHKSDLNKPGPRGMVPIAFATTHGQTEVVKLLLDAGAKIDIVDERGYLPIHFAAANGHIEIAKLLVKAGTKLDTLTELDGIAPYQIAIAAREKEMAEYLKSVGADTKIRPVRGARRAPVAPGGGGGQGGGQRRGQGNGQGG